MWCWPLGSCTIQRLIKQTWSSWKPTGRSQESVLWSERSLPFNFHCEWLGIMIPNKSIAFCPECDQDRHSIFMFISNYIRLMNTKHWYYNWKKRILCALSDNIGFFTEHTDAISYLYPHTGYDKSHMFFTIFPMSCILKNLLTAIQQRRKEGRNLCLLNVYFVYGRLKVTYFHLIVLHLTKRFIFSKRKQAMQGSAWPDLAGGTLSPYLISLFVIYQLLLYHISFQNTLYFSIQFL